MSRRKSDRNFKRGIPYNKLGKGQRPLVVFQGLMFEHKPSSFMALPYRFLGDEFTVYVLVRKPGLERGSTLKGMADDYAALIRAEFDYPIDVIGVSTGGSIAQHFAADYPELVQRLVLHSTAYVLGQEGKQLQLELGRLAEARKWRQAYYLLFGFMLPKDGFVKYLGRPLAWLGALVAGLVAVPENPNDLLVTIEAEDEHDFKDRLHEIQAPTLVIAGEKDPFYSPEHFRETAGGIPNASLKLYENQGHTASGKQFERDVLEFLSKNT
jgi:pimeloyl-ACP methyl ester carboxylesterase